MNQIKELKQDIKELYSMKKYPKELYSIGNPSLLKKTKISIVGTRRPMSYTKNMTHLLSSKLAKSGVCIVSGGAMGVDAIAHRASINYSTIMVSASGLDIKVPAINKDLITQIEQNGLVMGEYREGFSATRYSFVVRNEIVVALGDILIITEADLKSGSLRSAEFARKMGKEIFVLPHRVGESEGTNALLKENLAKPIYNVDEFVSKFGQVEKIEDDFLEYCKTFPKYDDAILEYGNRVLDYELEGKIAVENNIVKII